MTKIIQSGGFKSERRLQKIISLRKNAIKYKVHTKYFLMDLILSTRNQSKIVQIKELFKNLDITLLSLDEAGIEGEAIEDGLSIQQNAFKKADYAHRKSNGVYWTMADDTGLFIKVLYGAPGVKSARWAGEKATTEDTMNFCLKCIAGFEDRNATFRTSVVVISPTRVASYFKGEVGGRLLKEPRCVPQPQMPYSPLFIPNGSDKVWAEMSTEEENAISHRGIAFRQAIAFLEKIQK